MAADHRNGNGNGANVEPILVPVPIETHRRPPIQPRATSPSANERDLRALLANLVMEVVPAVNSCSAETADNGAQLIALSVAFNKLSARMQDFLVELRAEASRAIREAVAEAVRDLRGEIRRNVEEEVDDAIEKTNPGVEQVKEVVKHEMTAAELARLQHRESRVWQIVCIALAAALAVVGTLLVKK